MAWLTPKTYALSCQLQLVVLHTVRALVGSELDPGHGSSGHRVNDFNRVGSGLVSRFLCLDPVVDPVIGRTKN